MYRYTVDNAVTYTSEDFVLFRESPFACWMERLTLENPDHGIPPDLGRLPPGNSIDRQDEMADTLRQERKEVRLIDWDAHESERRSSTLEAMRKGADFIVNGQLALGPLSGAANLLMRTSGYSDLGDFLYIPCDTQARTTPHSAFRLCFLADLLHSLQGQLPPQMLIIRGGDDLLPLPTESHIYHYRAVKQRFMADMRGFRKHRMPDPAESSHFGRWSDCAHEVLKQRLQREEQPEGDLVDEEMSEPLRKIMGSAQSGGVASLDSAYSNQAMRQDTDSAAVAGASPGAQASASPQSSVATSFTLAEQAGMLQPGRYKPGPGVFRRGRPRAVAALAESPVAGRSDDVIPSAQVVPSIAVSEPKPRYNRRASDATLQNLEFIGSTAAGSRAGNALTTMPELSPPEDSAPAPSLREPRSRISRHDNFASATAPDPALYNPARCSSPVLDQEEAVLSPALSPTPSPELSPMEVTAPPVGSALPDTPVQSAIDMDGAHFASPPTTLKTSSAEGTASFDVEAKVEHAFGKAAADKATPLARQPFSDSIFNNGVFTDDAPAEDTFSSSLMTSEDYDD